MTAGRLKVWNDLEGQWDYVAASGGSQPLVYPLGPYTFTFESDLDALAGAEGVELFTPNVDDLILPIFENVTPWGAEPTPLAGGLSVHATVGTFQGDGTLLAPADAQSVAMWTPDSDLDGYDESGDLALEPTHGATVGWLTDADAFASFVRVRVATPICVKMTDSDGNPIGTYEGQFEDPPVAQIMPTFGESRFYFFVFRPTLTLPS